VLPGDVDVDYVLIDAADGSNYLWDVIGSAGNSPIENGVSVDYGPTIGDATIKVLEVDAYGCRSYDALEVKVGAPLAVESILQNAVSVYPNPAESDTKVSSSHEGQLYVRIIDALGREYSRTVLYGNDEQIMKTRQLPAGVYFVEISDGTHSVTKKLIRK
jgi:hypothetical protein